MSDVDFNVLTPCSDTGCVDTREKQLIACVDWVGVTFFTIKKPQDLAAILGLDFGKFEVRDRGWNGFLYSANYGNIILAWGTPENSSNMGFHIEMSGSACRQYEEEFNLNLNWSEFFALCLNFPHKFSRLDVAIDDYKGYFKIMQLYKKGKAGEITVKRVSKARFFETFRLDTGENVSATLYIGKGDWMFRFYDKKGQCEDKRIPLPDDIRVWNRYEIQLRNEYATSAAQLLAYQWMDIGEFVRGVLADKMDVKVKGEDSNRSRWKRVKWWDDFLGDVKKVGLSQQAPDPSIVRVKNWLDKQVTTSLAMLLAAFDGNPQIIYYFLDRGKKKMGNKERLMIEQFQNDEMLRKTLEHEIGSYMADRYRTGKRYEQLTDEERQLLAAEKQFDEARKVWEKEDSFSVVGEAIL